MKVAARVKMGRGLIVVERFIVDSFETAQEEIEAIIENYNTEEERRYGEYAKLRELIEVLEVVDKNAMNHDWSKTNLTTKGGYDVWECMQCALVRKRRMGQPPVGGCSPHLVCKEHNKQFASEANLKRHNKKYHEGRWS